MNKIILAAAVATILTGCAATGENLQANVYKAGQVNLAQAARTIKIITVLPAKIEIDNAEQKKKAQIGGALLGALAGGLGGGYGRLGGLGTAGTTIGGGAAGAAIGSLVDDKVLVDGVTIAYSENGKMFTTAEVGKLCQFAPGNTIIVSTAPNETRIQPNAVCPVEK